jgi:hypothetical protein
MNLTLTKRAERILDVLGSIENGVQINISPKGRVKIVAHAGGFAHKGDGDNLSEAIEQAATNKLNSFLSFVDQYGADRRDPIIRKLQRVLREESTIWPADPANEAKPE